jgi:hypothetical protein
MLQVTGVNSPPSEGCPKGGVVQNGGFALAIWSGDGTSIPYKPPRRFAPPLRRRGINPCDQQRFHEAKSFGNQKSLHV